MEFNCREDLEKLVWEELIFTDNVKTLHTDVSINPNAANTSELWIINDWVEHSRYIKETEIWKILKVYIVNNETYAWRIWAVLKIDVNWRRPYEVEFKHFDGNVIRSWIQDIEAQLRS